MSDSPFFWFLFGGFWMAALIGLFWSFAFLPPDNDDLQAYYNERFKDTK